MTDYGNYELLNYLFHQPDCITDEIWKISTKVGIQLLKIQGRLVS